jgi:ATP-dependent helicase HrpA
VPSRHSRRAEARAEERALLPRAPHYPDDLPITARKTEILAALAAHQVLVVAGETGSGKSTQLPKMCLEAGRGVVGMIGHTQPRRIAARSIAERVAEELGVTFGRAVGYKVRFTDRVGDSTLVKVMTDGVLLAELHSDPDLSNYDTLIIDEAHERSLNIDFILGYLKRLLPSRPDLKVIITSATIDTERFSQHFGAAPVIEVTGRTYPVEIRYRPLTEADEDGDDGAEASKDGSGRDEGPMDEVHAVCDAVADLCREGPGDILVFLPGEREIRDTAEAMAKAGWPGLEVLSLYGRLSSAEQHRIFEPHAGRRAVLSTNVAETSLTVPGIRYVVDLGTARISRYGRRTKVQRLPIERISQASANQRAGRCGRLGPGVCVRLYSEEDFAGRRPFTEPEILRTNLASVILQMAAIGLGDIEHFPFMEPPDRRNIADGIALLEELGAFAGEVAGVPASPRPADLARGTNVRLSAVGRKLAQLPLDPRLGRMVLEAGRLGCLGEVLVIASALSVQDPRERPAEKREAAAALHARFADESSDFFSYLHLWDYLDERQAELSSSQFRRLCRRELISYQRAREWQDVHGQLADISHQIGLEGQRGRSGRGRAELSSRRAERAAGSGRARAEVHQALLTGLVTQVGVREGERADFAAPRGARFSIWPGSVLAKKSPRWVMAAELVETSRLWGRVVAPVRPQWVERAGSALLKWSYSEPEWDAARGAAFVLARATLYGLTVVPGRRLEFSRLDRAGAREMFIRYALVEGDWEDQPAFARRNRELLDESQALLQRARRHEPLAGEEALFGFYASRVGPDVTSGAAFRAWWRRSGNTIPGGLIAAPEELWGPSLVDVDLSSFPDVWTSAEAPPLALRYEWLPGTEGDGLHAEVPLGQLGQLAGERLEWQVPGLREELVVALLRSLPKDLRRHLVPVPEHAREFVAKASPGDGPLLTVLGAHMSAASGVTISSRDFDWGKVPGYLRPTFEVVGDQGQVLASGKDVADLYATLQPQLLAALRAAAESASLGGGPDVRHSKWDFGPLPKVFEPVWNGARLRGYPALADEGDSVSVQVFPDGASARSTMAGATRRLLLLNLPSRRQIVDGLERLLDNSTKLALAGLAEPPYRSTREIAEDAIVACLDEVVARNGGPAWGPEEFEALVPTVRQQVGASAEKAVKAAVRILAKRQSLDRRTRELAVIAGAGTSPMALSLDDVDQQLAALTGPRFLSTVGLGRLPDVERYLAAVERRLERLPTDPRRDLAHTQRVRSLQVDLEEATAEALLDQAGTAALHALGDVRWMIEELRVSFFAQSLGTRVPVSEERVRRAIAGSRSAAEAG